MPKHLENEDIYKEVTEFHFTGSKTHNLHGRNAVPRAKRWENLVIRGKELEKSFPVVHGYIVPSAAQ
jgi:hypothetical protein